MWLGKKGKKDGMVITLDMPQLVDSVFLYLSLSLSVSLFLYLSFLNHIIAVIMILAEHDTSKEIFILCLKNNNG